MEGGAEVVVSGCKMSNTENEEKDEFMRGMRRTVQRLSCERVDEMK